jgi:PKD repeat protein
VTVNGTILNIYSTALENTNPGAPDPGIPGFVGPNGDGKTDCGTVNPVFITWASRVVDYSPADQSITETFSDPNKTLGPVTGDNFDIVSLGDLDQDQINAGKLPGSVTLGFDLPIADGEGPDLAVFENGFIVSGTEQIFAELAYVEVSTDGAIFARFPSISLTPGLVGGYGSIDPTEAYNLVGKHVNAYGDSWGTPFDLNTLAQEPEVLNGSVDLNSINYVRIVDIPGSGDFKDSRGNPIYDGWVTWGSGGLDLEAVGVINVGVASAPEANFTSDVTSGTAPLTVQFNDASSGVVLDYAWDFDNDGTVDSTLQNPEFTYEAPGTYNVSLTVSNTGGPNTETKANYIVAVLPDSPVADFSIDVTSGPAPLTVQFTDLTTNKPVSWAWDFESDGIIDSYEQNPSWTYNVAGNYTVTLTAANLAASDTVTKVNLTSVDNLPPMADFSADPVATLTGSSVQFTDLSANSPTSWQWDFNNDGTIDSTMQNPNYTYTTAGTYTVNLTVSNPAGNDDEVKTDYIIVREQASPASDFTYTSDGSSVTITEYTGSDGIVIIPAEIEGLPVTTIGASAFSDCSALTTASIPDSVTTIGDYAFIRCSGLTTVTIPDSVTTIGKYAFSSCSALTTVTIGSGVTAISDGVFYNCPSLTTLKIPNSVTTIGASAFSDCSALTTVSIPNSVTIIGGSAFQGCSALTTVTIPDSVTTIGGSAFQDCSGLTTVNIGSGVTNIGNFAFMGCFDLTAIDVDTDNSAYVSIDGILYNKDVTTLVRCPPGKTGSLTIPNSVTTIGYCAFYGCTALTSVTIPNSVTTIDDYAFMGCIALNSVTIGNNVTSIGSSSFYGCTGLTSVNMPDSVTSIGSSAFRDCSALTCMVFEGNAPAIGSSWAPGTNLAVYYYEGVAGFTTPEWQGVPCYSAFVDATGNFSSNIVYGSAPLTVTFTYTGVGANTFAWDFNNNGTVDSTARNPGYTYDVPGTYSVRLNVSNPWGSDCVVKTDYIIAEPVDNFTYISDGTSVTITGYFGPGGDVIIPDTIGGLPVTTIGDSVFQSNTNLTSVITGNNVTSIGSSAFRDCTALTSVTIGNNVTTIGDSAFRGSTALTSMTIPDSAIEIGSHAFRGCTSLASVTVPDSVTVIGNYVFRDCTSLTSATIGNNVTEISRYAFRSCSALTSVTIGNNVTTISSSAFRGSTALSSMVFMGNAPDSVSSSWADGCPDLVVYYQPGATDFTTPTWQGVSCYPILPVFSFMPEDATVINGQTTEIIISVDSLPEGLAGYNLTVDIDDPAVAEIVGIEYSWANLTENSSLPGTSVYLKALDGNRQIEAGATDVVLATLTVKGKQTGNTSFTLGIDRLDDDNGEAINATLDIGTLEVGMTSVPGQENSPQDLDGDGLYEDLSGDGSLSFVDVELYFHHMDWIEDNLPVANFDFNGNGRIDFDDIVDLFEMVA